MSRHAIAGLLLVCALFLLRYQWILDVPWIIDDFLLLDHASKLRFSELFGFSDAIGNAYRPLTRNLYFWIGQHVVGTDPVPYHAANLAVALAGIVLFFLTLRHLLAASCARTGAVTPDHARRRQAEGPALVGVLWYVSHPSVGTPVSWVCGIQDLLAVTLILCAVLAHLSGRRVLYVVAFVGAVLSKEITALLPMLLWLYDRVVERVSLRSATRRQLVPLTLLVIWAVSNRWLPWNDLGMTVHAPEPGQATILGHANISTVWFTLRTLLLVEPREGFAWPYSIGMTFTMVLVGVAIAAIACLPPWPRRCSIKLAVLGAIWSLLGILPLIAVESRFVYYAYYPALGLSITAAMGMIVLRVGSAATTRRVRFVVGAMLFIMLTAGAGVRHSGALKDAHSIRRASTILQTYERDMLRMHPELPDSTRCYFWRLPHYAGFQVADGPALRVWYRNPTLEGRFFSDYQADSSRPSLFFLADDDGHLIEIKSGLPDPYLDDPPPLYASGLCDLGTHFSSAGVLTNAIIEWQKALLIAPDHAIASANLGIALVQIGHFAEGVRVLQRTVSLNPDNAGATIHLAIGLSSLGQVDESREGLLLFLERSPRSPYRQHVDDLLRQLDGLR